ncbi:hypothetical protein [Streptomyces orinoci]|uniref:Secreted protein n=1 Tax=Streptomyces orinoci TaxID=67339 RepID=A0ABV3JS72_STRON|nr:hypothetical protein [Streptomyces orinoci]
MKRWLATGLASAGTIVATLAVAAPPAHAVNVWHACRTVNGVQTDGPLGHGWTAQPCVYLDYDSHIAVAKVTYHGGSTDVHLIAELGVRYGDGSIQWGVGQNIGPAVNPVGGGSAYEWSKFVPIPGGRGITSVFARARLMDSGIISGDVESGSVPLAW